MNNKSKTSAVLCFDMATTFSTAKFISKDNLHDIKNVDDETGEPYIKQTIAFIGKGETLQGEAAIDWLQEDPEERIKSIVFDVKRHMGMSYCESVIPESKYPYDIKEGKEGDIVYGLTDGDGKSIETNPITVSSYTIDYVLNLFAKYHSEYSLEGLAVTCPAHYTIYQRDAVYQAGTMHLCTYMKCDYANEL